MVQGHDPGFVRPFDDRGLIAHDGDHLMTLVLQSDRTFDQQSF
jgi:hypothetical protein